LNRFYKSVKDDFKSGEIRFDFQNLAEGKYSLTVKAWDTYNNSLTQTIEFIVEKEPFTLTEVKSFPNPFTDSETISFSFKHNRIGEDLEIFLEIYSPTGALVKRIERYDYNARNEVEALAWDGLNNSGSPLSPSLYIYRLVVKAMISGASQEVRGKVVKW
jgi:hypothetical protein